MTTDDQPGGQDRALPYLLAAALPKSTKIDFSILGGLGGDPPKETCVRFAQLKKNKKVFPCREIG